MTLKLNETWGPLTLCETSNTKGHPIKVANQMQKMPKLNPANISVNELASVCYLCSKRFRPVKAPEGAWGGAGTTAHILPTTPKLKPMKHFALRIFIALIPVVIRSFGVTRDTWESAVLAARVADRDGDHDPQASWEDSMLEEILRQTQGSAFLSNLVRELALLVARLADGTLNTDTP
jgi:hypothetical protein